MTLAVAEQDAYDDTPAVADGPRRRCLVTGVVQPRETLIRFVVAPDDSVVPDIAGRLPGRGMWTVARRDAVETAARKRLFARSARRAVQPADDIADAVERQLVRRCVDLLGLARRAGQAVAGFDEVRGWLRGRAGRSRHGVLMTATDAADDGRAKLAALAIKAAPDVSRIAALTAAEMGAAWGRERLVHAAVAEGGLATRLAVESARLAGFRAAADA